MRALPTVVPFSHPRYEVVGSEERVQRAQQEEIEVGVNAAITVEDEVARRIGPLDGRVVGVIGLQEPGVVLGHECAVVLIGP